jgi:hypothetical protein
MAVRIYVVGFLGYEDCAYKVLIGKPEGKR